LHRQAFESALASHMVRARTELGRWQAGMKQVNKALEARDPEALEAALKRWGFADDMPEVMEAGQTLQRWHEVAKQMGPVLLDAVARKDLTGVQAAMKCIDAEGPWNVSGADEARAMLQRYEAKTRRLRYALTERNTNVIDAALKAWDFGPEDPLYMSGKQMIAGREQQLEELRAAVDASPPDGQHLGAAVRAWHFETRQQDVVRAMELNKQYLREDASLRSLAAAAPAGLVRLSDSLQSWPFAPDYGQDSGFFAARAALEAYSQDVRAAVEASDGRALFKLWEAPGSGSAALRAMAPRREEEDEGSGEDEEQVELNDLVEAIKHLLTNHGEARHRLESIMAEASDLPASAAVEIARLVEEWPFANNDPTLLTARAWLRLRAGAAERSMRELRAATASGCAEVVRGCLSRCQGISEDSQEMVSAREVIEDCTRARRIGYEAIVADPLRSEDDEAERRAKEEFETGTFSMAWLEAPALAIAWATCSGRLEEGVGENRQRALQEGIKRLEEHAVAAERSMQAAASALVACAVGVGSADDASPDTSPPLMPVGKGEHDALVELTVQRVSGEIVFEETVSARASVRRLKQALADATGISPAAQRLFLEGSAPLEDSDCLEDQGVDSGVVLTLVQLPPPLLRRLENSRSSLQSLTSKDQADKVSRQRALEPIQQLRLTEAAASVPVMLQALEQASSELRKGPSAAGLAVPRLVADVSTARLLSFSGSTVPIGALAAAAGAVNPWATGALPVAVTEFVQTVPFFFEHFVPLRAAWVAAEAVAAEAAEALLRARRSKAAILEGAELLSAGLCEARTQCWRQASEKEVVGLLAAGGPGAGAASEAKLRWVERLLVAQLRPLEPNGRQALAAQVEAICEMDIVNFITSGSTVSTSSSSRSQAGFCGLVGSLSWLLQGKCKKELSWQDACAWMTQKSDFIKSLRSWDPLRHGSAQKLECARKFLLTQSLSWFAEGCDGCQPAQRLFAWAAMAISLAPLLPRAQALTPAWKAATSALSHADPSYMSEADADSAWDRVRSELNQETEVDPLWWLRLCGCATAVAQSIHDDLGLAAAAATTIETSQAAVGISGIGTDGGPHEAQEEAPNSKAEASGSFEAHEDEEDDGDNADNTAAKETSISKGAQPIDTSYGALDDGDDAFENDEDEEASASASAAVGAAEKNGDDEGFEPDTPTAGEEKRSGDVAEGSADFEEESEGGQDGAEEEDEFEPS